MLMVNGFPLGVIHLKGRHIFKAVKGGGGGLETVSRDRDGHHPNMNAAKIYFYRFLVLAYATEDTVLAAELKDCNRSTLKQLNLEPVVYSDNKLPPYSTKSLYFSLMWSHAAAVVSERRWPEYVVTISPCTHATAVRKP